MRRKVSKESVNYRQAPAGARKRCATCSMFESLPKVSWGGCTLVRGVIAGGDVCDKWAGQRKESSR